MNPIKIKTTELKELKLKYLEKQGYSCAICGMNLKPYIKKDPRFIHWDHEHSTGYMRGVVCRVCNIIEGKAWNAYCRQIKVENRSIKKYKKIIQGLMFYYDNHLHKDLIHPTHGRKKRKTKKVKKCKK